MATTYYAQDADGVIRMSSAAPFTAAVRASFPQYRFERTEESIEYGYDGKLYRASALPARPDGLIRRERQAALTAAIQQRLDEFARTRGYDGIMSAASYAASANPVFQREGQYAVLARDAAWAKGYEILNAVLAGERAMPTLEEVFAELPALRWPGESGEADNSAGAA